MHFTSVFINTVIVSPVLQMRKVEPGEFVTVPRLHSSFPVGLTFAARSLTLDSALTLFSHHSAREHLAPSRLYHCWLFSPLLVIFSLPRCHGLWVCNSWEHQTGRPEEGHRRPAFEKSQVHLKIAFLHRKWGGSEEAAFYK